MTTEAVLWEWLNGFSDASTRGVAADGHRRVHAIMERRHLTEALTEDRKPVEGDSSLYVFTWKEHDLIHMQYAVGLLD